MQAVILRRSVSSCTVWVIIPPRTGKEIIQLSNLAVFGQPQKFTGYDQKFIAIHLI